MNIVKSITYRSERLYQRARKLLLRGVIGADYVGRRAVGHKLVVGDYPTFKKTFAATNEGKRAFDCEVLARKVFGDRPWMVPIVEQGERWITMPMLPENARLDRIAFKLSSEEREAVAAQAVAALFDMYVEGFAHRDFHAQNAFWHNGQLFIVDYEALGKYPADRRVPFPKSYDMTGEGLDSPHRTGAASYSKPDMNVSFGQLLDVPAEKALVPLQKALQDELREASLTFKARERRHTCNAQRIYNSFNLEWLGVEPGIAQRDSGRRLVNFGVTDTDIRGKRILDLGSNIGGMLFELQKYSPGQCVGVEYDQGKVRVARRVAAYSGLNNISFIHADIDGLDARDLTDSFDVVLCLAIVEHVKKPNELYRLLGAVTGTLLLFEGNSGTDPAEVKAKLKSNGFAKIEYLGFSDDDCREKNNRRPIFRAWK